ncbi:hypothetical protein PPROV_000011600 [Pycnococcus provasolii]|uniref:Protein farnesyltransferase subunit beta n=2 Tax=Pycnococcus provasolii TaxID=41880 RepID=A0A830H5R9_9CHLO|nr:hypothetical protein PPROV_000011600 [Pycnococcus provasolii]
MSGTQQNKETLDALYADATRIYSTLWSPVVDVDVLAASSHPLRPSCNDEETSECSDDDDVTRHRVGVGSESVGVVPGDADSKPSSSSTPLLPSIPMHSDYHASYLRKHLRNLPKSYGALDASRPWLLYWTTHALAIMGETLDAEFNHDAVKFLATCQTPSGGFGGGPGQLAHMASTYAAVCALATIGTDEALAVVDRHAMASLISSLVVPKERGGGIALQLGGEVDVRGCYTVVAVCKILGIDCDKLNLRDVVVDFVVRSQTYEGGIAGEPGAEAHGGYTFCGVAALVLLGEARRLNLPKLLAWAARRQCDVTGGFNGRTNKLVDACYSFWQAGVFPLLYHVAPELTAQVKALSKVRGPATASAASMPTPMNSHSSAATGVSATPSSEFVADTSAGKLMDMRLHQEMPCDGACAIYSSVASQGWVLACSQLEEGGFRDKPGKARDLYHTCYALSGLSAAQHFRTSDDSAPAISYFGTPLLERTDVMLNILESKAEFARAWVARNPM